MSKHTPGPWRVEGSSIQSDAGYVAELSSPRGTEERDANARLIAAAPDLLKTLEATCGYLLNAKIDLQTGCTKATAIRTIEGGLKMAQEAIAKATPTLDEGARNWRDR